MIGGPDCISIHVRVVTTVIITTAGLTTVSTVLSIHTGVAMLGPPYPIEHPCWVTISRRALPYRASMLGWYPRRTVAWIAICGFASLKAGKRSFTNSLHKPFCHIHLVTNYSGSTTTNNAENRILSIHNKHNNIVYYGYYCASDMATTNSSQLHCLSAIALEYSIVRVSPCLNPLSACVRAQRVDLGVHFQGRGVGGCLRVRARACV